MEPALKEIESREDPSFLTVTGDLYLWAAQVKKDRAALIARVRELEAELEEQQYALEDRIKVLVEDADERDEYITAARQCLVSCRDAFDDTDNRGMADEVTEALNGIDGKSAD